jgi:integrase
MTWTLLDGSGRRKYLNPGERASFIAAASRAEPLKGSFCLTLALTGARISEVLALTTERVDVSDFAIVLETLKRRRRGVFRAVPVPVELIAHLQRVHADHFALRSPPQVVKLWSFSRTTAWKYVREVMQTAGISAPLAKPKALRHAFAIEAVQQRIALSVIKKWLGHAKIETTALYADPIGDEERSLAGLMWKNIEPSCFSSI